MNETHPGHRTPPPHTGPGDQAGLLGTHGLPRALIHHDSQSAALALADIQMTARVEHREKQARRSYVYAAARVILGSLFVATALAKIFRLEDTERAMTQAGLTDVGMLLPLAIGIEIIGGVLLACGLRARAVSIALITYLGAVTVLVNHDLSLSINATSVVTNVGFCAALMMLFAHGSGVISLDRLIEHHRTRRFDL